MTSAEPASDDALTVKLLTDIIWQWTHDVDPETRVSELLTEDVVNLALDIWGQLPGSLPRDVSGQLSNHTRPHRADPAVKVAMDSGDDAVASPGTRTEAGRLRGILELLHIQAETAQRPDMADYLEGLPDDIEEAWREANLPACTATAPADHLRPNDWHHPDAVDEGSDGPSGVHVWRCPHCGFVWEV